MTRYNAWYNGSTTITLTGNPNECPDETLGPISNALGIGGMKVPGNDTLDRTTYDNNPFYFYMPHTAGPNISVAFQSSTDYYIEETQSWTLSATKSGDGYDVSGYWIGTLPTDNYFYHSSTKCWQGGDFWPNTYTESDGEHAHWNITGRLTPDSATWTLDQTWITSDSVEWHVVITFEGNAYTDGPRLATTEAVPTTEGCLGCEKDADSGSSSGDDTSSTASGTRTSSSSSASATSGSEGSSTGSGTKVMVDLSSMGILVLLVAGIASSL